ncbi:EAL domain-containing protein [Caldimonas tepidiphila]|uniref:EAL domain-containing protein n=1 Tax=Caldimonas tepidiphila TaxID=2315841 RepID=UPI001475571B|nr:EAL domain-containing protein [Caldimonas tepidiphila]
MLLDLTRSLMQDGQDEQTLARLAFEKVGPYLDADLCFNYRADPQTGELSLLAGFGIPAEHRQAVQRLVPGQAYCGLVAASRKRLVADAVQIAAEAPDSPMHLLGIRAYASHPLLNGEGQLLGTFSLASTRRSDFTPEDVRLLQMLSHFIALAWERLRTERALRRREEQHRLALDAGRLGTWRRDLETDEFHMDLRAQAHFGFDTESVPSQAQVDRVHPEDIPRLEAEIAVVNRMQPGEQVRGIEYRVIHPDGSVRWLSIEAKVFLESGDAGPRRVCVGTTADITERKRIEQALHEAAEDMKRAQAMSRVGSWRLDLQRQSLAWSEEVYRIFGRLPGAVIDYEAFLACVHPQDRAEVERRWQAALAGGPAYDIEHRILVGDGVKWVREKAELEFDAQGRLRSGFGIVQDITERKQAELALRDSQQHYEALFANQTTAIAHHRILCDAQGRPVDYVIEKVNQTYERMAGVRRDRVEGRRVTEVFAGIRELEFDFIAEFGRVALETGEGSFEVYYPPTRQWLSIYAYSPKRGEVIALFSDVTMQKQVETALRDSEASLRATFEQAAVGIVHVGADGRFLRANSKFCEMTGYSAQELRAMRFLDLTPETDRDAGLEDFRLMVAGEIAAFTAEKRYRRRDQALIWVRITASAVSDPHTGCFKYNVSIVEDITAHREAEQRARDAALHDPLTRLPNRRLVFEYAEHVLAAASRHHRQGAFLFIDLDRFKPINDLYGHEVGDRLLEEVARRLLGCVRHEDLVGRLGGDEFLIVLPHLDAAHHAAAVAHHVIDRISQPVRIRELSVSVTPSVGISCFPQHGLDADALVHAADLAMYRAKQGGAGSYEIYTPELALQADRMSSLEARLKRALQRRELVLHYQPVVNMRSGRPTGAEALLRIADGDSAPVGPDRFIPVAEAAGLIGPLGEWVAAEACRQHAAWRAEGLPPVTIAINVSPLQFRQRAFAQRLVAIVREHGIDPACFQVEVTESTVMDSVPEAIETLQALKSAGIRVALDDFGTGYSSLSHLSQLPLDKLKVDQSFVRRLEHDRASRAITDAVIALGRTLDMEVVGEGIESDSARAYLCEHGCEQGQGYLFSRPLPPQEFAAWYRRKADER